MVHEHDDEHGPEAMDRRGAHDGGKQIRILVAVRCRALQRQERENGGHAIVKPIDGKWVVLEDPQTTAADDYLRINKSKERRYGFDEVFDEFTPSQTVYERTTRFLISSVLHGFNATVFAYGATGAGKTFTMLGKPDEPGIMMLTLKDLFQEVASQKDDRHFQVKCSFLEVYNENIRDLLRPEGDYLDIREDPVKGMCVAGISEMGNLESAQEIMAHLHQGNKNRTTEATGANVTSSRSHAVLQVIVEQRDKTAGIVAQVNVGKLSMIDLAGSERASQTNNRGIRMIEGANINRSLLALGNCITSLSSGHDFVPYRDSKMTRLLKDSLGGNCRTVMIANVGPCHFQYEDTHNTLKYASRAKSIKTKAERNVVRVETHVSKYSDIIKSLRDEVASLKGKIVANQAPSGVLDLRGAGGPGLLVGEGSAEEHEESAKWKEELMRNFEERVDIKKRLIDLAQEAQTQMVRKSRAQVGISRWQSSHVGGGAAESEEGLQNCETPRPIRDLQDQLKTIQSDLSAKEESTRELEARLVENLAVSQRLQTELPRRVLNKDMRAFLGLVYRIYVLEVENMDLKDVNDVTAPVIHQRDLEVEALRLQIQMHDKLIEEQDQLLADEGKPAPLRPEGWEDIAPRPAREMHLENQSPLLELDADRDLAADPRSDSSPTAGASDGATPDNLAYYGRGPPVASRVRRPAGLRASSEGPAGQAHDGLVLPPISPAGERRGRRLQRGTPERGRQQEPLGPLPPLDVAGRGFAGLGGLQMLTGESDVAKPSPELPGGTHAGPAPEADLPFVAGLGVARGGAPSPAAAPGTPQGQRAPVDRGKPPAGQARLRNAKSHPERRDREGSAARTTPKGAVSPVNIFAEGSALQKDEGQEGSSSERVENPAVQPSHELAPTRNAAQARRSALDRLNRKPKPGSAPASVPKVVA